MNPDTSFHIVQVIDYAVRCIRKKSNVLNNNSDDIFYNQDTDIIYEIMNVKDPNKAREFSLSLREKNLEKAFYIAESFSFSITKIDAEKPKAAETKDAIEDSRLDEIFRLYAERVAMEASQIPKFKLALQEALSRFDVEFSRQSNNRLFNKLETGAVTHAVPDALENIKPEINFTVEQVARKADSDPVFLSELFAAFAKRGIAGFGPKTTNMPNSVVPLADNDPKLWKNRQKNDNRNAVEFIRDNYGKKNKDGKWHHDGLTRAELQRDPELYLAYAQWIKPKRHPGDALTFASSSKKSGGKLIENAEEATDRRRASARESKARSREKERNQKEISPKPS